MGVLQDEVVGDVGSVPCCQTCGSSLVSLDARLCWNSESGLWEVEKTLDTVRCYQCKADTELNWSREIQPPNQRVRELNDRFRKFGIGNGSILLTSGIQGNGGHFAAKAVQLVRAFDDFSDENDPWGEHDFGSVEVEGEKVFFKLDYYDQSLQQGSKNSANDGCTHRVLTIMLASEY